MSEWKVLEKGEFFEERYQIETVLGVGGFAHVYRARQVDLDREVAIKVLRPPPRAHGGDDEKVRTWIERFRREAKVISKLRDPHTITMYDYGHTDSEMSYMVFEFVSGRSLDVLLAKSGAMGPERVASILQQSLQSIREAHSLGILHRDLKPANLLLYKHMDRDDRIKVLDFGIAKPMREADAMTNADLTQDGSILGTPRYMAPEQLKGEDVGPSSDLYSLGLVSYELLTGKKAVAGDTTMTVISRQLSPQPIELPRTVDVPAGLRSIINGMLAKDLEQRYGDAAEVLEDLRRWDADEAVRDTDDTNVVDVTPPTIPPEAINPVPVEPPAVPSRDGVPRQKLIAAVSAATVVVVGGILVFILFLTDDSSKEELSATDTIAEETDLADAEQTGAPHLVEESDEAPAEQIRIITVPSGAQVKVDGEEIGVSPAGYRVDDTKFPLTVTATHGEGYRGSVTVEELQSEIELSLERPSTASGAVVNDSEREATTTESESSASSEQPDPTSDAERREEAAPEEIQREEATPQDDDETVIQDETASDPPPDDTPSSQSPFIPLD